MTRREAGLLRARTMTPEHRMAMTRKGNVVKAVLEGLGRSDGRPSASPWMFTATVHVGRGRVNVSRGRILS